MAVNSRMENLVRGQEQYMRELVLSISYQLPIDLAVFIPLPSFIFLELNCDINKALSKQAHQKVNLNCSTM